jgi:hypothetical protein
LREKKSTDRFGLAKEKNLERERERERKTEIEEI